ncbi:MAG: thiamine phosphate synthase [Eubacterium sp.]
MFKIIAMTNRNFCGSSFLRQIEKIAASGVSEIILREKDLLPEDYAVLARQVRTICQKYPVTLRFHTYYRVAKNLKCPRIHLSLPVLEENPGIKSSFDSIGVSIHSLEQAEKAVALGADYLTAGHIFATDCKKGLAPRGIPFLKSVLEAVSIPVYGIGGIDENTIGEVAKAGASGVCLMSSLMLCENPTRYVNQLKMNC